MTRIVSLLQVALLSLLVPSPSTEASEEVYRDNVVVVLDCSGSMKERMGKTNMVKMDAAKNALKEVLSQIPPTTHVGILTFSARNLREDWIYPLGPLNSEKISRAIDQPLPGGGTPLGAYMKTGADRLLERRKEQYGYGSYRLLIVTDGQAGDQELVQSFGPEIISRGVTLDVVGVNMPGEHTLAKIAHSYRSADDPDSLRTAITEIFAEVSKGDGGDTQEDAFELIAPIPIEMAQGMLGALTRSGNDPIGAGAVAKAAPNNPANARQANAPVSRPPQHRAQQSGGFSMATMIVFGIIGLAILRAMFRKALRR